MTMPAEPLVRRGTPDPLLAELDMRAPASDPEAARARAAQLREQVARDIEPYRRVPPRSDWTADWHRRVEERLARAEAELAEFKKQDRARRIATSLRRKVEVP